MPTLKSAAKRMRQAEKRRLRNQRVKTRIRNVRSALFAAIAAKNVASAKQLFQQYCSLLDKAAKRGIIKKNTAIRRKTRSANKLRALAA